jgi:hypothetical protein
MLDVTPRALGALFAFLLPGSVALYGLGFWFNSIARILRTFLTDRANFPLFLLVLMAALVLGILAHGFRWLLFEEAPHKVGKRKRKRPPAPSFAALRDPETLAAYREAVDQTYRYHGFFGGMAVVAPLFFAGLVFHLWGSRSFGPTWLGATIVIALVLEVSAALAALSALGSYRKRSREILQGEQ